MWLLSCDGDLFGGKDIWLRPGTTHLLGRTNGRSEAGEQIRYIDHKSVSRKHLTIQISAVRAGDSTRLHTRSEIKITDGSKIGTTLNGARFSQDTKTLTEKEYTIKLGSYEPVFHLRWRPVTLSFTSVSKKSGRDALAPWREKLERADVKLSVEYVTNETTHVVSKKRNTPATLQALLQARWLVTDGFAEALATAVKRGRDEVSPLEEDFAGNWPQEDGYLVPSGVEPKPRPDEYLKPNQARIDMFQDFVFVFQSQTQHDTLLPVITAGGGKALVRQVDIESASVQDFVDFVKEAAGQKNSGPFRLSQHQGRGGVVVVRMGEREPPHLQFMRNLDLALDQRSMEQNEFLDAVLMVDISGFRKQLEEEQVSSVPDGNPRTPNSPPQSQQRDEVRKPRAVTVADSPAPAPAEQEPPSTQPQPEEPEQPEQPPTATKKRNRRIITQSRFKGFDDFDPSQFSKPASQSPEPFVGNREGSVALSDRNMDIDEPSQRVSRSQQISRKRPAPAAEESEDAEDVMNRILPGHAAMKRQKTLAEQTGKDVPFSKAAGQLASEKAAKAKKKTKEIDVKAEIQARRQREEERHRKDEEALREELGELDLKEVKNLLKIEEISVPARNSSTHTRGGDNGGTGERWDPTWNGRKNFKKFRRQGQRGEDAPRLQRVIVALEEVPKKGHGGGDDYWLGSSTIHSNKSKSQSQSQSQSVRRGASRSQYGDGEDEDESISFRRHLQRSREIDEENAGMEDISPDEIAGQARDPALQAMANVNSSPSQTMRPESQRKASGKRPAAQLAAGAPAAKKAKQSRLAARNETIDLDDDDDDALKFRRRRK